MKLKKEADSLLFLKVKAEDGDHMKNEATAMDVGPETLLKDEDVKPLVPQKRIRYFLDYIELVKRPSLVRPRANTKQDEATRTKRHKKAATSPPKERPRKRKFTVKKEIDVSPVQPMLIEAGEPRLVSVSEGSPASVEEKKPTEFAVAAPVRRGGNQPEMQDVKVREESPNAMPLDAAEMERRRLEDERKMKLWKNPKMKVKKENMAFSADTIRSRLEHAGIDAQPLNIECSKDLLDELVSRKFLSSVYGGNSQMTFPPIGKVKLALHGLDDFMYLNTDYQPIAPEVPGAPGIWITPGGHDDWEWNGGIMRVFTRITKNPARWLYQGQYELKVAKSLTKEEWSSLSPSVRNTWAKELCVQKWGIDMRVRIYWRKQKGIAARGKSPTEAEYNNILNRKLFTSVDETDVALYLQSGDETMSLVTMRCVGYDVPFQTEAIRRWRTWVPTPKDKSGAKSKSTGTKGSKKTKVQKLKEEVIDVDSFESDEEEDEYYEEDTDGDEPEMGLEPTYIPRGTRSRPRM